MKIFLLAALATATFITGCGNNTPGETAVSFVENISEKKIDEARELATENGNKIIDSLIYLCRIDKSKPLIKESLALILDEFGRGGSHLPEEKRKELNRISAETEKILQKEMESMKNQLMEEMKKYISEKGGKQNADFDKLEKEFRKKYLSKFRERLLGIVNENLISKMVKIYDLDDKYSKEAQEVAALYYIDTGGFELSSSSKKVTTNNALYVLSKSKTEVTDECLKNHTDFYNVDKTNIIEEEKISADKTDVRLEIIYADDKSKKESISLEKIKEKWLVDKFELKNLPDMLFF
jgi:hypothetical protein